jgi:aldose 1-epimerase
MSVARPPRHDAHAEYILENGHGLRAHLVPVGATLRALYVPDRHGRLGDVVLGFDDGASYAGNEPRFGCTVGRCANRIDRGRFELDGRTYQLSRNVGEQHLHGGVHGFGRRLWQVRDPSRQAITFALDSADGDEGYPGNVNAEVRYTLTDDDRLVIEERARTDRPTIINLTNHSYFNLADGGVSSIHDHVLTLAASEITPLRPDFIPTGARVRVVGTPYDFRAPCRIGSRFAAVGGNPIGYDVNYAIDGWDGALRGCARLHDPVSGRTLTVATTKPGVQLYTGNFLDARLVGKHGVRYAQHAGVCLETQYFPDAPNQPAFPSVRRAPGEDFAERTEWGFGIE